MSILYTNDFESQIDQWSSTDLVTFDGMWGFVSPSNSLRFSNNATYTPLTPLSGVTTIQFQYNCGMGGFPAFYYDSALVQHALPLVLGTCDTITWNDSGALTVNDTVSSLYFELPFGQSAIDDLYINGLDAPAGPTAGFGATQGITVVTEIGNSMGNALGPILPIVFGVILVATVAFWGYRKLVDFIKRI